VDLKQHKAGVTFGMAKERHREFKRALLEVDGETVNTTARTSSRFVPFGLLTPADTHRTPSAFMCTVPIIPHPGNLASLPTTNHFALSLTSLLSPLTLCHHLFAFAGWGSQVIPPNVRVDDPRSEHLPDAQYREGVVHWSRGSPEQRERVKSYRGIVSIYFELSEQLYLSPGSTLNCSPCVRMFHAPFLPWYLRLALHQRAPVNSFSVTLARVLGGFSDPVETRIA